MPKPTGRTRGLLCAHCAATATATATEPDGKILTVGTVDDVDLAMARYTPAGLLDPSFGTGGTLITSTILKPGSNQVVALQPDGRIVIAGTSVQGYLLVARFNGDGSVDSSFGTAGQTIANFGAIATADAIAVGPDRSIVVAGGTGSQSGSRIVVLKLTSGGNLDTRFNDTGMKVADPLPQSRSAGMAIAFGPDGKLVIAGETDAGTFDNGTNGRAVVLRYNSDGSADASFGKAGIFMAPFPYQYSAAQAVRLLPNGQLQTAGFVQDRTLILLEVNSDGTLDTGFGSGGYLTRKLSPQNVSFPSLMFLPDGRVLAGGYDGAGLVLVRANPDATLDATFGQAGYEQLQGSGVIGMDVGADGSIAVTALGTGTGPLGDFTAARFTPAGNLDASFANGGFVSTPFIAPAAIRGHAAGRKDPAGRL